MYYPRYYQEGGNSYLPHIMQGVSNIYSGFQAIDNSNRGNRGTAVGSTVGTGLDTALGAFGIPTFGMGQIAGSAVGSLFNKPHENALYTPSGNVNGSWARYMKGGYIRALARKNRLKRFQKGGDTEEMYGPFDLPEFNVISARPNSPYRETLQNLNKMTNTDYYKSKYPDAAYTLWKNNNRPTIKSIRYPNDYNRLVLDNKYDYTEANKQAQVDNPALVYHFGSKPSEKFLFNRAYYKPSNNTMMVYPELSKKGLFKGNKLDYSDFVEELAHAKQYGSLSDNDKKSLQKLSNSQRKQLGEGKGGVYETPNTVEYNAHKEISPKLWAKSREINSITNKYGPRYKVDLQKGGYSKKGLYPGYAPSARTNYQETNSYRMYMDPDQDKYLDILNETYGFPPKTLQTLAFTETATGSVENVDGKRIPITTPTNRVSPAGAKGMFQFMAPTAREYGLEVNSNVDQRNDIRYAAQAAAKKLDKDWKEEGSLHNALIKYNGGNRQLKKYKKHGLRGMAKETQGYNPKFEAYREQILGYPSSLSIPAPEVVAKAAPIGPHQPYMYKSQAGGKIGSYAPSYYKAPKEYNTIDSNYYHKVTPYWVPRHKKKDVNAAAPSLYDRITDRLFGFDVSAKKEEVKRLREQYNRQLDKSGMEGKPNQYDTNRIKNILIEQRGKEWYDTNRKKYISDNKYQQGGWKGQPYQAEIEGGEYIFNTKGIDETKFKMIDDTGKDHTSKYGFLAKGMKHKKGDTGGIKVLEGDAYIASQHLGVDGKKATKRNPSVAKLMLRNGGKALANGHLHQSDKFGINNYNPGAVRHHLNLMNEVKLQAELGKVKVKINNYYK